MVKKSLIVASALVGVALAATTFSLAQQPNSEQSGSGQTTNEGNRTSKVADGMRHDLGHYLTECVIDGNQAEITLAKLAGQKATDPEVKKFAEKMIEDHTAFVNKLQSVKSGAAGQSNSTESRTGGPGVDINVPAAGIRVQAGESSDSQTTGDSNRGTKLQGGGARQFLQVKKEVAAQCLQTMTRELSQKEGSHFDRCYINGQVAAHMKMADELSVFSRHATGDLQPILQEGLQTTKQHLETAKQIAERLDNAPSRTANREGRTTGQ
jgi:predicted outer membrane protein